VLTGMKSRTGANTSGGQDFIGAGAREVQNGISLDGVSIVSNLISANNAYTIGYIKALRDRVNTESKEV